MTTCITTFSKDGYELYGHRMIQSWLKFWPSSFKLIVYTEGYSLTEKDSRLIEIDIESACPNMVVFKTASSELLSNSTNKKEHRRIQKTVKWCHKVYAINHALKYVDDYLIFLDGDTYTTNNVPNNFAESIVNNHLLAVHFELLKDGLHFETGLIVFNLKHKQMPLLKDILVSGYDSLDIYNMNKTWDGFWLAHLYQKHNLDVFDMSTEGRGVFGSQKVKDILKHDVGSKKYTSAGYNHFTGRKQ